MGNRYENKLIFKRMLFIVFLVTFACEVYSNENLPSQPLLQLKGSKRSINDNSVTFPSGSSSSYSAPIQSSSGYELSGSSSGFSPGHAGLINSGGHGIGYLSSSSGLGFGSPGLSHQNVPLSEYSAQSTYSVPNIASHLGSDGSSNALFTSAKTGPVTFGIYGGGSSAASTSGSSSYSSPVYASGGNSAYNGGASNAGLQVLLGSSNQHSPSLGSLGASSYSLPIHSATSSPSHSVTGGLIIASGSHGSSSSYALPASTSSHGISTLGSSSGTYGASSTYSLPISSGSHGISALSSGAASSSYPVISGIHSGLSGISSGGSSYQLPTASGSYSNSGSSNAITYMKYIPFHSSGSSPSVFYATPSISHVGSSSSGSPSTGSSYTLNANYAVASSSPVMTHVKNHGYTPKYYISSGSHGTSVDSQGAHTSVNPKYVSEKNVNAGLSGAKYDTISYSVPYGKF